MHWNNPLESSTVATRGQGDGKCPWFRWLITTVPRKFGEMQEEGQWSAGELMACTALFYKFLLQRGSRNVAKNIFLPLFLRYRDW